MKSVPRGVHTGINAAAVCKTKVLTLGILFLNYYLVALHSWFFFLLKILIAVPNELAKSGGAYSAAHQTQSASSKLTREKKKEFYVLQYRPRPQSWSLAGITNTDGGRSRGMVASRC